MTFCKGFVGEIHRWPCLLWLPPLASSYVKATQLFLWCFLVSHWTMFRWQRSKVNPHISWYKYFIDFDFERKWTSEKAISSWYRCHYHCSPQSLYNMPESQRQFKTSKDVRVHLAHLLGLDDWVSAPQDPPGSSTASTTASPRARPTTPHPSQDLLQLLISFPNLPSDQFRSQI